MRSVIANHDAEAAVLGAVLLTGRSALDAITLDVGLRPKHFHNDRHCSVFSAMVGLADAGREVDTLTVVEQLRETGALERAGGPGQVDALAGAAPAAGNWREYAGLVLRTARWECRRRAALGVLAAVEGLDESAFVEAEAQLVAPERAGARTLYGQEQAEDLFRWLADTGSGDAIPLPFSGLNDLLGEGLLKGDATVIGTWTSWGKSALAFQLLRHAADMDVPACCYSNEMAPRHYALRTVADVTGIPFFRLMKRGTLTSTESERVARALGRGFKVPIQPCADWSAKEIARHVRRANWDIVAVDLVHRIPHQGVEELNAISSTLNNMALQADCHVLLLCQLNNERNKGAKLPRPVKRDIRGTGQLANDAANVLMISREQEEVQGTADMWRLIPPGALYFEKARNGALGGVPVWFDNRRMKYVEEEIL